MLRKEFEYFCKWRCKYRNDKQIFLEEINKEYVECPECGETFWDNEHYEGTIIICEYCPIKDFVEMVELEKIK